MCKAMEDMRNEAAKMKAVHIARLMLDGGKLSKKKYIQMTVTCLLFWRLPEWEAYRSSPADSLFIDIISIIRNSVNYIENSKATITF